MLHFATPGVITISFCGNVRFWKPFSRSKELEFIVMPQTRNIKAKNSDGGSKRNWKLTSHFFWFNCVGCCWNFTEICSEIQLGTVRMNLVWICVDKPPALWIRKREQLYNGLFSYIIVVRDFCSDFCSRLGRKTNISSVAQPQWVLNRFCSF